jgi:translocation and assembly module TamB
MIRNKKLATYALIFVIVLVCIGVGGYSILRSPAFHDYVLTKIEETASQSTGAKVQIQNFSFRASTLTADAYGIVVHGTEGQSARPLLSADRLTINLKIVSLLRRKVDLKEIILRHPVVNLAVKKDGSNNLPHPPKTSGSSTNIFDLGIQHVLLTGGEVYYNDVKTPLDAELHDLQLEVRSRFASNHYDGKLSYQNGRLQYGELKPLPHALNVAFSATPSDLTLKPLVLNVASSTFELNTRVQDFANPRAEGTYTIVVYPQDLRPVLQNPNVPSGQITLAGSLRYQYAPYAPLIREIELSGDLQSPAIKMDSPQFRTIVRNLQGKFQFVRGNLDIHRLEAELLGGRARVEMSLRNVDSNPIAKFQSSVQGVSLAAAKASSSDDSIRHVPLEGHLSGTAEGSWAGSLQNLKARTDWQLRATMASAAAGDKPIPVMGEAHVNYNRARNVATLAHTFLRTPQNRIDLSGTAGQQLDLQVQARAADLRELQSLAGAFRRPNQASVSLGESSPTTVPVNLGGAADAQFVIQGSMNDPTIRGRVSGRNLQVENTQWKNLMAEVQARKTGISIRNGSLVNARQGYVNFGMSAGLSNWHYLPSSPISVRLNSRGLAIGQILRAARLNYPVSGNLSADISVRGSQISPVGAGTVQLLQARVYGQQLQDLSIRFQGNGESVRSTLSLKMPSGSATGNLSFYPRTRAYELQVSAPRIVLAQLQPVQERNLRLAGVLSASASGRGTVDNPQVFATVQVPQLQVQQTSISGIKAQLNVANHIAQVALDSEVAQSFVQARGTVNLADGYYTRATLDTRAIPLEGLLALAGPVRTNGVQGQVEVHASAQGSLKDRNSLQAQVVIPTLQARYQELQIANRQPIRMRLANSVVAIEPTEIAGTDTEIRIQGQLPLRGNVPPSLSAVGSVDAKLLRLFQPDTKSSGKLALDIRATRVDGRPAVQGQLRLQDVSVLTPDAPLGLEHVNGLIDVRNNQATITQLTGKAGGGQISATGSIGFRPQLQMDVVLKAENVRVRYQDAIRTVLTSDLELSGTSEASTLSGQVTVNSLGFTQPDIDLAALAGQFQSGYETPPSQGFAETLKLNINVRSSQLLNVASTQVNLRGNVNLRVIGTAAQPVIVGRTEFTGGDIFLMGKRYKIQRGIIEFSNPATTEPVLNVQLTTTINQYDLTLNFLGPLDKLRTSYVSDPPLPSADVINLIARGKTQEQQQAEASPSNFGASSLLAKGVASQVSSGVQKLAGFSSFSIDPTLGGNDRNPGARIGFQKRVTKSLFLTFATDVTSAQREIIQGEYQFNRRWSATVTRDENGGVAVDGKFHTKF